MTLMSYVKSVLMNYYIGHVTDSAYQKNKIKRKTKTLIVSLEI